MIRTAAVFLALTSCSALAEHPTSTGIQPGETEAAVARTVGQMLSTYHYNRRAIDDEVAVEWMDAYIEALDFNRMFFLQSDVDEFRGQARTIDDDLAKATPTLSLATKIYERYQQRVSERVAQANAILDAPIDLANDESYVFDRSEAPWPANDAEAAELWRQRIEEQFILGALAKKPEDDTRDMLRKRYHRLETDIKASESMDVLERYLSALTHVYDPHTTYFKPASADNFDIEMANSLEGIGASLRTIGEHTVVMDLIAGGPAEKGGLLKPNDKIIAVAQGKEEPVDVIDLPIDRVVKLIRGKKGTEVRLTVIPADAADPSATSIIPIVRDKVVLADSDAELKIREIDGKRFAVIEIPSFYLDPYSKRSASRDLERILTQEMGEVDGVILDLRENGGGALTEAVDMTGLFIKRGPVVQIREQGGDIEAMDDEDPTVAYDGPLMVLVSPFSASASEIVAGAIQDYGRGIIVGSERTHGKGSVQTVIDVSEVMSRMARIRGIQAGALKLTTQKFYRVNGASTQVKGVQSDVIIPSPWDGLDVYEGDLDHALPWDEIEGVSHPAWGTTRSVTKALQAKSTERVAKHPDFQKMAEDLVEREKRKAEKTVSLNLETRRAERALEPEPDEDEDGVEKKKDAKDPVLDEALLVMRDYLVSQG
ncbi:MAG: carboxy terminal-processing peptidase [Alphaproteobacteria bacterium]|nr:carboxy terminal-processing peptidase [Alphaproteobacteria bacterium]